MHSRLAGFGSGSRGRQHSSGTATPTEKSVIILSEVRREIFACVDIDWPPIASLRQHD